MINISVSCGGLNKKMKLKTKSNITGKMCGKLHGGGGFRVGSIISKVFSSGKCLDKDAMEGLDDKETGTCYMLTF
jgi:hypothetical protein